MGFSLIIMTFFKCTLNLEYWKNPTCHSYQRYYGARSLILTALQDSATGRGCSADKDPHISDGMNFRRKLAKCSAHTQLCAGSESLPCVCFMPPLTPTDRSLSESSLTKWEHFRKSLLKCGSRV